MSAKTSQRIIRTFGNNTTKLDFTVAVNTKGDLFYIFLTLV